MLSTAAASSGRGRIELTFDDPRGVPLDGTTAVVTAHGDDLDLRVAEQARARHVPVQVIGRPDLSTIALSPVGTGVRAARDTQTTPRIA